MVEQVLDQQRLLYGLSGNDKRNTYRSAANPAHETSSTGGTRPLGEAANLTNIEKS